MKKYEYTQSIGFRLKGGIELLAPKVVQDEDKLREVFLQVYRSLLDIFTKTVLFENKEGEKKVSKFIAVKYPFLKLHAKEQYFSPYFDRRATKAYSVKDAPFLLDVLLDWLDRNEELYSQLYELLNAPEESQASKSDILYKLKQLYGADNAFFIRNFVQYASHKKEGNGMQLLQKRAEQFNKVLEIMLPHFAPQQSSGAEVARASFNYYTLNKTAKDYDEEERQRLEEINSPYLLGDSDKNLLRQVGFVNYIEAGKIENLSIEELYVALKDFKSKQKADFVRDVQGDKLTPDTFAQKYPLFTTKKETFLEFYDITKQLDSLNREEARNLAKKRGKYFQYHFKQYVSLNNLFKKVAIQFGKLKVELRAIEREEVEARLLRFWAMILEEGEKKYLLLVPKEYRDAVRHYIGRADHSGAATVFVFHSFTLRALEKIIRKEFPKDIPSFNENEQFFIERVKQVLRGEYEQIDLSDSLRVFQDEVREILRTEYEDKETLRKDFDRLFYKVTPYSVDKGKLLTHGALLYEISAYDLERDITAPPKAHTKLWQTFWSEENMRGFSLRLNQEMRLFYRDTVPQEDSEGKKSRNRFSAPQLRVQFSFTHNVGEEALDTTFAKDKELQERFNRFNSTVVDPWIEKLGENVWYYGIDRGNQELATLGVIKWGKEKYKVMLKDGKVMRHHKPVFASFTTYTIKNPLASKEIVIDKKGNKKAVSIGQNPSFFMSSEEEMEKYFVKNENQAFLDLTTAKLIKGKIVEDGDVKTYLNLKRANAKRKLFEVFTALDSQAGIEYCDSEKHPACHIKSKKGGYFMRHAFVIKNKETEHSSYTLLCYFSPEQRKRFGDSEFESLQKDLTEYLHALRKDPKKQTVTIEQINHLRDAITANMVGIIAHLFENYPGFINLENLLADADRHFANNNENIARRLEWALYRKFQKLGLVPPRLRNTLFLRKDAKFLRLGIIHFVPTEHTSGACPRCLEKADTEKRKEEKWNEHAFTCTNPNCGFSTQGKRYEFEAVSNSDDVAACNIANPDFASGEFGRKSLS